MATYFKGNDFKKKVDVSQWYNPNVVVEGDAREIFEKYCDIPSDQVVKHVSEVRDRAWENMQYACIGSCRFLNFSLSQNPNYPEVLSRLTSPGSNETFLDLGCCFGHDMRKLVHDGVPSTRVYGLDIDQAFIDRGYELFLDRDKLSSQFIIADLFSSPSTELIDRLGGGVNIIYAASFFNLFNWDQQILLASHVIKLLKLKAGSMILGRQLGNLEPGEYPHLKMDGTTTYWHNIESWKKLWAEVGKATDSEWRVEASLDEKDYGYENNKWGMPSQRRLLFAVYRR